MSSYARYLVAAVNLACAALSIVIALAAVQVTAASGMVGLALPPHTDVMLTVGLTGLGLIAVLFGLQATLTLRRRWRLWWQLAPLAAAALLLAVRYAILR
jgi:hypothetical protein